MRVRRKMTIRPPTHIDRAAQTAGGGALGSVIVGRRRETLGWLWVGFDVDPFPRWICSPMDSKTVHSFRGLAML